MNRLIKLARTYEERIGTHWLGCEEHHRECLIVKLADALEQAEAAFKREQEAVYTLTESLKRAEAGCLRRQTIIGEVALERDALRALLAEARDYVASLGFSSSQEFCARIRAALREDRKIYEMTGWSIAALKEGKE
jgi:hypothetical protein